MSREETRAYSERRRERRHAVAIDVNYRHDDTYLYSRSNNISELGIFLVSSAPAAPGTVLELVFALPDSGEEIRIAGEVMWTIEPDRGPSPGMGIRFVEPSPEIRQRIRALIRTIAYLE